MGQNLTTWENRPTFLLFTARFSMPRIRLRIKYIRQYKMLNKMQAYLVTSRDRNPLSNMPSLVCFFGYREAGRLAELTRCIGLVRVKRYRVICKCMKRISRHAHTHTFIILLCCAPTRNYALNIMLKFTEISSFKAK